MTTSDKVPAKHTNKTIGEELKNFHGEFQGIRETCRGQDRRGSGVVAQVALVSADRPRAADLGDVRRRHSRVARGVLAMWNEVPLMLSWPVGTDRGTAYASLDTSDAASSILLAKLAEDAGYGPERSTHGLLHRLRSEA